MKKAVSISIEKEIWKEFKLRCFLFETSMTEKLQELILKFISEPEKEPEKEPEIEEKKKEREGESNGDISKQKKV